MRYSRMSETREGWVEFDKFKPDPLSEAMNEVSLDEDPPRPIPPSIKSADGPSPLSPVPLSVPTSPEPPVVAMEHAPPSSIEDSADVDTRNGKVLATVLPTNDHLAWISPPKYDTTKVPDRLVGQVPPEVYASVMRTITGDYRFRTYAVFFSRVLIFWVVFSILILLALLLTSPNGGFSAMVLTLLWTGMLFAGVFFCIVIRKHLRIGLHHCVAAANKATLPLNMVVGVHDRGQMSCHKVAIIFMAYNTADCLVDIEKLIRLQNATTTPKPVLMTHDEVSEKALTLLKIHIQPYLKSVLKRRLLFPTRPAEGVSDFQPKHCQRHHCLCQFVEDEEFNPESNQNLWYEYFV